MPAPDYKAYAIGLVTEIRTALNNTLPAPAWFNPAYVLVPKNSIEALEIRVKSLEMALKQEALGVPTAPHVVRPATVPSSPWISRDEWRIGSLEHRLAGLEKQILEMSAKSPPAKRKG